MSDGLTRRALLKSSIPALAAAGALGGYSAALAQIGPGRPPVRPEPVDPRRPGREPERDEEAQPAAERADSPVADLMRQAFNDQQYALPPLPYEYDALEPHIDEQTMRLHHERHHQAYVNGLNSALEAVEAIGRGDDEEIGPQQLSGLQRDLTFNGGGHVLHTVFWATMGPEAGGEPEGQIAEAIQEQFGSFDAFRNYFARVAATVKGSGWAILGYEPIGDRLIIFQSGDQDLRMIPGGAPLLPLDVWEHAYYLRYQNERSRYIDAWWNVINWQAVNQHYQHLRELHGRG